MQEEFLEWFEQFTTEEILGTDSRTNSLQGGGLVTSPILARIIGTNHGLRKQTSQSHDLKASVPWLKEKG